MSEKLGMAPEELEDTLFCYMFVEKTNWSSSKG
jgi:hypothetical protein